MSDQRSRDPFTDYDAAYVFGALSVEDRAAYEDHLPTCAACRDAVTSIAGLPGLLARVPVDNIDTVAEEAPASLLPRLLGAAAAERRRVHRRTGLAALVAAACVVAALIVALRAEGRQDRATGLAPVPTPTVSVTASLPTVPQTPMRVVSSTELSATAGLQSVAWGTRIEMRCTYPVGPDYQSEESAIYAMRIVPRAGQTVTATTWNVVPGKTLRLEGDTHLRAAQIAAVQLVSASGVVLLELDN